MKLKGGMGNQMFQYALGRKLAISNKTSLGLDVGFLLDATPKKNFTHRNFDLDVFSIEAEIVSKFSTPSFLDRIRKFFWKKEGEEKAFSYDKTILDLKDGVYLDGYWQSPKYFSDIKDLLQKDFTLRKSLSEKTQKLQEEINAGSSVCIHVRRGDFVGNSLHGIGIGQDYYNKGIEYISSKTVIDKLYVFSDDIEWCQKNLSFSHPVFFVSDEYVEEKARGHFALMRSCKHFVIANSTFSWWAAWLALNENKIVIAPEKWFSNKSINTSDLIPASWIRQ